ncbi:MAG: class I SAM-dependent methyltransferase [bacterium]|nr:class I SAM-dependent methyltransferase [bacterium]
MQNNGRGPVLSSTFDLEDPTFVATFDELTLWSARFGVLLLDNLRLRPGVVVLDLGTAAGFPALELAQLLGPRSRVVGVDIWKEALTRAEMKREHWGISNVEFHAADAVSLPFADAEFDLVVSNLGINNFEDPEAVASECNRVLKRHGTAAFTTNLSGHMREFYAVFREVLREFGRPEYLERLAENEAHRGTRASVRALLENGGFVVSRMVEDSFNLRYADGRALLEHRLSRVGFLDGWRACVDKKDEPEAFVRLERKLDQIAAQEGEIRTKVPMLFVEAMKNEGPLAQP